MRRIQPGWFVKDRSDIIMEAGEDKLRALLDAVFQFPGEEGKGYHRKYPGWLFAACNGYQLLEEPHKRVGRRDKGTLHAYAEPVHSIAELVHSSGLIRRWEKKEKNSEWMGKNKLLWWWSHHRSSRSVILQNQA